MQIYLKAWELKPNAVSAGVVKGWELKPTTIAIDIVKRWELKPTTLATDISEQAVIFSETTEVAG